MKLMPGWLRATCTARLLPLLMLLTLSTVALSQYQCTTNSGKITITGYTGPGGNVVIPNTINGLPVVSIGNSAFSSCTSLTNVRIPTQITSIGDNAFTSCTGLTNITFNVSVTNIGEKAFEHCTNLTSVSLPCGITRIKTSTFDECYNLTNVTLPRGLISIEDSAFEDCEKLTSIAIPSGVTNIGMYAFYFCKKLSSITIPNSVTRIGESAFLRCINMTDITLPQGLTSIEGSVFHECTNLTNVAIPASVTYIGPNAFHACANLKGVYFRGSPPGTGTTIFDQSTNVIVYYSPSTAGWGTTFAGRPTQKASMFLVNGTVIFLGGQTGTVVVAAISSLETTNCILVAPGLFSFLLFGVSQSITLCAWEEYKQDGNFGAFEKYGAYSFNPITGTQDVNNIIVTIAGYVNSDWDDDGLSDYEEAVILLTDPEDPCSPIQVDDDGPNDPGPEDPNISDPLEDGSRRHPYDSIQKGINGSINGMKVVVFDARARPANATAVVKEGHAVS